MPKLRALFIGNSYIYFNNVPHLLNVLTDSAHEERRLETKMIVGPGFTLERHWADGGDVSVLDVAGRLTLSKGSSVLCDTLHDLAAKGHKKILVNLGEVSYLDSSAIGELFSGYTLVANYGGQLKLLGLTKRVRNLLLITKSYSVFDVHDDEAVAIRSFS